VFAGGGGTEVIGRCYDSESRSFAALRMTILFSARFCGDYNLILMTKFN
jgi:hypothetical protein